MVQQETQKMQQELSMAEIEGYSADETVRRGVEGGKGDRGDT